MKETIRVLVMMMVVLCLCSPVNASERFIRGKINGDGEINISDAIFLLSNLFLGTEAPQCVDASDTNDDGRVDISDAVNLLDKLFISGQDIPLPYPQCGPDLTLDSLSCENFEVCLPQKSIHFSIVSRDYVDMFKDGVLFYEGLGASNGPRQRGLNVARINPVTGDIIEIRAFDTWGNTSNASLSMLYYLRNLRSGELLLFGVCDSLINWVGDDTPNFVALKSELTQLGSRLINRVDNRVGWVMMTVKGEGRSLFEAKGTPDCCGGWGRIAASQFVPFPNPYRDSEGNTIIEATPLEPNTGRWATIENGDTDVYSLQVNDGDIFRVLIKGNEDLEITLLDGEENVLAEAFSNAGNYFFNDELSGGEYFVKLKGISDHTVSDYNIWFGRERREDVAGITLPPEHSFLGISEVFQWTVASGLSNIFSNYVLGLGYIPGARASFGNETAFYDESFWLVNQTTVSNIPPYGGPVYATLYSRGPGGIWQQEKYLEYQTEDKIGHLEFPTAENTIDNPTQNFAWSSGRDVEQYYLIISKQPKQRGEDALYDVSQGLNRSTIVGNLPQDGEPLYVRLSSRIGGQWFHDSEYATFQTLDRRARMISPAPGTMLNSSSVVFEWDPGSMVDRYTMTISYQPGQRNEDAIAEGFSTRLSPTSGRVNGIPQNGKTINVRLWSRIGGYWNYIDYQYPTANVINAHLTSPVPGQTITNSDVNFEWDTGTNITIYHLVVSSELGKRGVLAYYDEVQDLRKAVTVTNLPLDGKTLYVRLWSKSNNIWGFRDYQFETADTIANMISPQPGLTITESTVNFVWNHAEGAEMYQLTISRSPGRRNDIREIPIDSNTNSIIVNNLPLSGEVLYVRLWTVKNGRWQFKDYAYRTR